jgi:hypothetical protein
MKRGVAHSLISRSKVICQDQKDFNNEIKNISYYGMLNGYPQEFVDSIMKPSRSERPPSYTIHQGTVIIPYIKDISRNSNSLETVSMSGPFSEVNMNSM